MQRLASTDGVRLAVRHLGDGPPLLMAHATGFCGPVLGPLARGLADRFSCWAYDARGHGDSVTPPGPGWEWWRFGDDVTSVIDGLGLEKPFGFGHSSGGASMLDAEARRPGTFAALWCYEPIVWPEITEALAVSREPLIAGALKRRDHFASRDDAYDNFAAKPPLDSLDPGVLRAYVDCGFEADGDGVRLRCRPEVEASIYRQGLVHDGFTGLGRVRCPVTIGRGEQSVAVEAAVAEAQVNALARGSLVRFDGLGHFGPLEDPAGVARAVAAALAPA